MYKRPLWNQLVINSFASVPIVWLGGVRRVGKTTLTAELEDALSFDCERPSVRQQLVDPEAFLDAFPREKILVLDELHRLDEPSELLKLAADHYPGLRVLATGSSTLQATARFRDSLTGRKREIWLRPLTADDLVNFPERSLDHRMLRGGLPALFLSPELDEDAYAEWVESFWAKDVTELFRIEKRRSFLKHFELTFLQSGGLFEAQALTTPCELSRQTVMNYLEVLELTGVVQILRPFHGKSANELISQPKVYGFDTGFWCFFRGLRELRDEDRGQLLEHLVLGELLTYLPERHLHFWRDKQKHEIDFVHAAPSRKTVDAIECKMKAEKFEPDALRIFRKSYPTGRNIIACADVRAAFSRNIDGMHVEFVHWSRIGELDLHVTKQDGLTQGTIHL